MLKIIFKDHIGEWLVPVQSNDSTMYQITGEKELTQHHMKDMEYPSNKIHYGTFYDNSGGWYRLTSDEDAQKILNARVKPHPNQKVIDKILQMKARRKEMGYDY